MSPSRSTTRTRISLASGAGGRHSPAGFIGALAIHAAIVAATLFTWEHRLDIAQESPPVVPVDLVTLSEKTNITPAERPAPKIEPQVPVAQLEPDQLIVKQPVVPQVQPEPAPPPDLVAPKAKPQPPPEKKKTANADDFQALLNKIASAPTKTTNTKTAPQTRKGIGAQNAMTMDLVDMLRNQIEQCWSPPAGAPHPEQLVVYIELVLNPDGNVARPPQLAAESVAAAAGNPFMRAAADAAQRAIYVCAPFKLPADRYADWRDSTIKFDPRDLAGQ